MSYSLVPFQVKFASDVCVLGLLLEASGKGRKEFPQDDGSVIVTDYDPSKKRRVRMPSLAEIANSIESLATVLVDSGRITGALVRSALKDQSVRERLGLLVGMPLATYIKSLSDKVSKDSRLSKFFDIWIDDAQKRLADQYGDDKNPFAQAVRKGDGLKPSPDASFQDKMEFYVARYALYSELLKKPEKYIKPTPIPIAEKKEVELVGKMAAAAIPFAVGLAISGGFGIALPLLLGEELISVLAGFGLSELTDFGVQKGLDKANVDNQWIRFAASMTAGVLSWGIVATAVNKMGGKALRKAVGKVGEEEFAPSIDDLIPDQSIFTEKGVKPVGKGGYGTVYRVGDKVIKYGLFGDEYEIAKKMGELGIAPKVYVLKEAGTKKESALSMEWVGGLLLDRFQKGGYFNGKVLDRSLEAMSKMHMAGIAHNDLHVNNIIVTGDSVKIIDLGLATEGNYRDIFQEMLSPRFFQYPSTDWTPGSQLRSRYEAAVSKFKRKYKYLTVNGYRWDEAQGDPAKAVEEFYKGILK